MLNVKTIIENVHDSCGSYSRGRRVVKTQPASAATLATGVTATMDSYAKSGIPGSVVTYTLTLITNPEDVTLELTASTTGGWPSPSIVPSTVPLDANVSQAVTINVPIPSSATSGQNDVATIVVKDGGTPVKTIQLTTTAKAPSVSGRPLVVVNSYTSSPNPIKPYQEFTLSVVFENRGQTTANNLIVTFAGTDLYPRSNGGVSSTSSLDPAAIRSPLPKPFWLAEISPGRK